MIKKNLDEVGPWTEIKLEILKKYAQAYTQVLSRQESIRRYIYIDAFAGPGTHISREKGVEINGSPAIAMQVSPAFSEYHLIDLTRSKANELRNKYGNRENVFIYEEDCNQILCQKIFPRCRFEDYARALCLLDPYAISVDWEVLETAGEMRSIEVFYNFMIMDGNMNVFRTDPSKVTPEQIARMDRVWGDHSWRDIVYRKEEDLFGNIEIKNDNPHIAEAFRKRLLDVAGFKYVPKPVPMKNSCGSVIYYLYFASPNRTGHKIVEEIFSKYRQ